MPNPQYALSSLRTRINYKVKGALDSTTQNGIINEAVRMVMADVDLYTTKRKAMLSLDGANAVPSESVSGTYKSGHLAEIVAQQDKFEFHCPSDLKGNAVVDIQRRVDKANQYDLTTPEEFQRRKSMYGQQVAIDDQEFSMRKLLVSGIEDISNASIHACNTYDGDGTWAADGAEITAVSTNTSNYLEGSGSIGFTTVTAAITGGTLTVADMTAVDISAYEDYSVYAWVYIPMATGLTSFTLKWGSSSANYFSRTVTATHDNVSFFVGWNLLRFPWADATETGTVVETAVDYIQLTVVKGSTNTGTTGWLIDNIWTTKDSEHDVIYYTEYGWQNASGIYILESTADTDLINADAEGADLIILKAAELCSEKIDDQTGVKSFMSQYNEKKVEYEMTHPSQRMLESTIYQGMQSIDTITETDNDTN